MELLSPQRGSFTVQGLQFFFLFLLPLSDPFSLPLSGGAYDVEDGEMHLYRRHFKLPPKCGSNPFKKKKKDFIGFVTVQTSKEPPGLNLHRVKI